MRTVPGPWKRMGDSRAVPKRTRTCNRYEGWQIGQLR